MSDLTLTATLEEQAYHVALHLVAQGDTRADTKAALMPETRLTLGQIDRAMADALKDALTQGVEREDIDPSWFKATASPTPFRTVHHTDAGHRYSDVHARYSDGSTTKYILEGHWNVTDEGMKRVG